MPLTTDTVLGSAGLLAVAYLLALIVAWPVNAYQFVSGCDFEPVGRCEIVKGAGIVIPPLSVLTVWGTTDTEDSE